MVDWSASGHHCLLSIDDVKLNGTRFDCNVFNYRNKSGHEATNKVVGAIIGSVRFEEIVQTHGQFFSIVQTVALDGTSGQTTESQITHWFDEIREFLVLKKRFEGVAVQVLGVLQKIMV